MSENGPIWEIYWEPGFQVSLKRMGMTWEQFDRLGKFGVDLLFHYDPYEPGSTFPVEETNSRVLRTEFAFPDLQRMLIGYVTDDVARTVTVLGAEPVLDDDDFEPLSGKQPWIL